MENIDFIFESKRKRLYGFSQYVMSPLRFRPHNRDDETRGRVSCILYPVKAFVLIDCGDHVFILCCMCSARAAFDPGPDDCNLPP